MNATKALVPNQPKPQVPPAIVSLAHLLKRFERNPLEASADQYRHLAARLKEELERAPVDARQDAILRVYRAAADIYENLRYEFAGLCRVPLEQAASTELEAKRVIDAAAKRPTDTGT